MVTIKQINNDLMVEGMFPATNKNIEEQLKKIREVSAHIGYYDAYDAIGKMIKNKHESKTISDCWNCPNKIVQTDIDEQHDTITGCSKIRQSVWNTKGKTACPLIKT